MLSVFYILGIDRRMFIVNLYFFVAHIVLIFIALENVGLEEFRGYISSNVTVIRDN